MTPTRRRTGEGRYPLVPWRRAWQWIPALAGMTVFVCSAQALPSYTEVKAAYKPSDITLLDRHGTPIQTVRVDKSVRRLPWVPLREVS
ncbi:MAG TPA: hypothetical protein VFL64_13905, partial [Rhizobacter sp.]|nr:hypothetical protein [Rhizobacter sp.]